MERTTKYYYNPRSDRGESSGNWSSPKRWCPTRDHIRILWSFYQNNGDVLLSSEQIQSLCDELRPYGAVEPKNIFYWYQNCRARRKKWKKSLVADGPSRRPLKKRNSEYHPASSTDDAAPCGRGAVLLPLFPTLGDVSTGLTGDAHDGGSQREFLPMSSQKDLDSDGAFQDPPQLSLKPYTPPDETRAQSEPSSLSPILDNDGAFQDLLQFSLKPYTPPE